jgi:hypothetical protein
MAVFDALGRVFRRRMTRGAARLFDVVFLALFSSRGRAAVIDCSENKGPLCCRLAAPAPCFFALHAEQWAQSAFLSLIEFRFQVASVVWPPCLIFGDGTPASPVAQPVV